MISDNFFRISIMLSVVMKGGIFIFVIMVLDVSLMIVLVKIVVMMLIGSGNF